MSDEAVLVERRGRVGILTINRPKALNALNSAVLSEMLEKAGALDADTPMGALAQALYAQFVENEDGLGKDFSAMLPRFEGRGRG